MGRKIAPVGLLVMTLWASSAATRAEPLSPQAEARAKLTAAFVLNFLRFAEWPTEALGDDESPLQVLVVGPADALPYLEAIVQGQRVHGREVRVAMVLPPQVEDEMAEEERQQERERFAEALSGAHAVFVPDAQRGQVATTLALTDGRPVLTISEAEGFLDAGGMIEIYLRRNRVVFDASRVAIREAGLQMSSKVLRLAQRVEEE